MALEVRTKVEKKQKEGRVGVFSVSTKAIKKRGHNRNDKKQMDTAYSSLRSYLCNMLFTQSREMQY